MVRFCLVFNSVGRGHSEVWSHWESILAENALEFRAAIIIIIIIQYWSATPFLTRVSPLPCNCCLNMLTIFIIIIPLLLFPPLCSEEHWLMLLSSHNMSYKVSWGLYQIPENGQALLYLSLHCTLTQPFLSYSPPPRFKFHQYYPYLLFPHSMLQSCTQSVSSSSTTSYSFSGTHFCKTAYKKLFNSFFNTPY